MGVPFRNYRPPPRMQNYGNDGVYTARRARADIAAAEERERERAAMELLYAQARMGILPRPYALPQGEKPKRGESKKASLGKRIAAGVVTGLMIGAGGLAMEGGHEGGAVAQSSDYSIDKIVQESAEIEHIEVSPNGEKLVYEKLKYPDPQNQGHEREHINLDLQTGRKTKVDSGPWDTIPSFDNDGNLIYTKTTEGPRSELRKQTPSGDDVLDSCDNCQIGLPKAAGGKVFYGRFSRDASGELSSDYYYKEGRSSPVLISTIQTDIFWVSEDGAKIAFIEKDGSDYIIKILDTTGKVLNVIRPHPNNQFGAPEFGYGKIAVSESGTDDALYLYNSDGSGGRKIFGAPYSFRDVEWKGPNEISFVDPEGLHRLALDRENCEETLLTGFDIREHKWHGNALFFIDGKNIYRASSNRFSQPVLCGFVPQLRKDLELPFFDDFRSAQMRDEWEVVRLSESGGADITAGGSLSIRDAVAYTGKSGLTDYRLDFRFRGDSIEHGQYFSVLLGKDKSSPTQEIKLERSQIVLDGKLQSALSLSMGSDSSKVAGKIIDNGFNDFGIAVANRSLRVYLDGKQVERVYDDFNDEPQSKSVIGFKGRGIIDDVSIKRWFNRPPVINGPRSLALTTGETKELRIDASDPDGDPLIIYLENRNPNILNITRRNETSYAVRALGNGSSNLRLVVWDALLLPRGSGPLNKEAAEAESSIVVNVVGPNLQSSRPHSQSTKNKATESSFDLASTILIGAGTAIGGALGVAGYYARRNPAFRLAAHRVAESSRTLGRYVAANLRARRRAALTGYRAYRMALTAGVPSGAQFSAGAKAYQPPLRAEDDIPVLEDETPAPQNIPLQRQELTAEQMKNILKNSRSREEAIRIIHLASGKPEEGISRALTKENYRRLKDGIERGNL